MIKVQNIYYMLSYAFQTLKKDSYEKLATEDFRNTGDLFAAILAIGIGNQIKRGLGKEYVLMNEELSLPKSKIMVSESIKRQTAMSKHLVCQYDEFSENIYLNQIIKTTAMLLIRSDIKNKNKKALKKVLIFFDRVDLIDPISIQWNRISYNRNNKTYQLLINICYLTIKGMLLSNDRGERKLSNFIDDQNMSRLYEKFVLGYFIKEYPELTIDASYVPWDITEDTANDYLPAMHTDVTIKNKNDILIIDTKWYQNGSASDSYYGNKQIFHSGNLYQIYAYVKNMKASATGSVSGMLLYAKADEDIAPDSTFKIGGDNISVRTLDLACDFNDIKAQLDSIIENAFSVNSDN